MNEFDPTQRKDDLQWSTQSAAAFAEVQLGLDPNGKLTAFQIDHYMPPMQDDRLVGALLAGLPTIPAPNEPGGVFSLRNNPSDPWLYDGTSAVLERAYGTNQIGQLSSPINVGLRDHSLRTPTQYQQNFPREMAITEAAVLAGVNPLQFRLQHTSDARLIAAIETVRDASGWDSRNGRVNGNGHIKHGQGISTMLRNGTYWACVANITVDTNTGAVKVEKSPWPSTPASSSTPFS